MLQLICGDTHGLKNLLYTIRLKDLNNCKIYHVGDFGIGFQYLEKDIDDLEYLNKILKNKNIFIYINRGNHDNPFFWNYDFNFSNIKFIKSYEIVDNILFLGGAISIDRSIRTKDKDWWEEERFDYSPSIHLDSTKIEYIISHSSPINTFPFGFNHLVNYWIEEEKKLNKTTLAFELKEERENLYHVIKDLNPKKHYFGHFHTHYNDNKYRCVTINEICKL